MVGLADICRKLRLSTAVAARGALHVFITANTAKSLPIKTLFPLETAFAIRPVTPSYARVCVFFLVELVQPLDFPDVQVAPEKTRRVAST